MGVSDKVTKALTAAILTAAGGLTVWGTMQGWVADAIRNEGLGTLVVSVVAFVVGLLAGMWLVRLTDVRSLVDGDMRMGVEYGRMRPREREVLARMLWVGDDFDSDYAVTLTQVDASTYAYLERVGAIERVVERDDGATAYILMPEWRSWLDAHRDELPDIDRAWA